MHLPSDSFPAARRHLQRLIALVVLVGFLLPAMPAGAIVGSSREDTGAHPHYPYVGGVWRIKDNGKPLGTPLARVRANGILIAPNVVLTEEGSYRNGQHVAVSFSSPIPENDRKDPVYQGYVYEDPAANGDGHFRAHDVAVIILEQPVPAAQVTPAVLAGLDTLDTASVTAVSYGPTILNGNEATDFTRRFADGWAVAEPLEFDPPDGTEDFVVRLAVPDGGLTCDGDQGGPILQGDDIVALLMNWYLATESICDTEGVAYGYRLDTPLVQGSDGFLCLVRNTNFAALQVADPVHPQQNIPYPNLTQASKAALDAYGDQGQCDGQSASMQAANHSAGHHHKHKHGGHHRGQRQHRH